MVTAIFRVSLLVAVGSGQMIRCHLIRASFGVLGYKNTRNSNGGANGPFNSEESIHAEICYRRNITPHVDTAGLCPCRCVGSAIRFPRHAWRVLPVVL